MIVTLEHIVQVVKDIQGELFYNSNLPAALREAQTYAGPSGYIASLPQLVQGRIVAPISDEVWTNGFTANSEELVGTTSQGHSVVLVQHNGGIFSSPERIELAYSKGLTDAHGGKLDDSEFSSAVNGHVRDLPPSPVYSFSDFQRGIVDLPMRYGVILDFALAQRTPSGYQEIYRLADNPLFIARAGGAEQAAAYLARTKERWGGKYGQRHVLSITPPSRSEGRLLFLGGDYDGVSGSGLGNCGRFVGVRDVGAPEVRSAQDSRIELERRVQNALTAGKAFEYNGIMYAPLADKSLSLRS